MSSGQLGIVPNGDINNDKIIKPGTIDQTQIHRDESPPGSGFYYGKLNNGTEELIGGPGFNGKPIESGSFQISSDGSSVQVNGIPFDVTVRFSVDSVVGLSIGDTITDTNTGATGIISQIQVGAKRITLHNLTPGIFLVGDGLSNGSVFPTITNAIKPSWSVVIPTNNQAKIIFFTCTDPINNLVNSYGIDSLQPNNQCTFTTIEGGIQVTHSNTNTNSIFLRESDNNLWGGIVSAIVANSFTIQFFSGLLSGVELIGRYKIIT